MAKKLVLVLVLAALVAGGAFADWENPATWGGKKNFISGTVNILGLGVTYERILAPQWSVGADAYLNWFFLWTDIEVGGFARFYPWNGLFVEMGLGFHMQYWGLIGILSTYVIGAAISPGVGFKFDPGKPGGFFVEPGIKFPITLGANKGGGFGWGFGAIAYVGLGYAF